MDQDERREAKVGATKTLLGEALERTLAGAKAMTGEQIGLFDQADPLPDDAARAEIEGGRARGRPPGARNKATEELRAWVRVRYGDPGLKLMERIFADPKALAQTLGAASAWDVAKAQAEWMIRVLPYFWSAMPAELKIQAKGALAVGVFSQPGAVTPGDRLVAADPFAALLQIAQNQGLSDLGEELSNDPPSNASPVPADKSEA